jgi:hypothetical protein
MAIFWRFFRWYRGCVLHATCAAKERYPSVGRDCQSTSNGIGVQSNDLGRIEVKFEKCVGGIVKSASAEVSNSIQCTDFGSSLFLPNRLLETNGKYQYFRGTLSGKLAWSITSKRSRASPYFPAVTSSSTCSAQGLMISLQIDVPSIAAALRSFGVVTKNSGDLEPGGGVRRRAVHGTGGVVDGASVNGNARVCARCRERDDMIWMTAV